MLAINTELQFRHMAILQIEQQELLLFRIDKTTLRMIHKKAIDIKTPFLVKFKQLYHNVSMCDTLIHVRNHIRQCLHDQLYKQWNEPLTTCNLILRYNQLRTQINTTTYKTVTSGLSYAQVAR